MRMKGGVLLVVILAMLLAVAALAGSPTDKQCGKVSAGQATQAGARPGQDGSRAP